MYYFTLRDVGKKKPGKCGNFPKIFLLLPFIFGRSPMLKTVKKSAVDITWYQGLEPFGLTMEPGPLSLTMAWCQQIDGVDK